MSYLKYLLILLLSLLFVPFLNAQDHPISDVPHTPTFPAVKNPALSYQQPEKVGLSSTLLQKLSDNVLHWVADGKTIGAEIMITKDRKIVLHEAMGWNDREAGLPMRRNSIFRLLALTKPFTGTAALMLVENGTLRLDAPVSRWLPAWDNERSGEITVRHLLTHTGGFRQYGTPRPIQRYPNLRAAVDDAGRKGPQHRPGETSRYSDVHSYALGALVEETTGIPVEQFIKERILDPLGLDDTHIAYAPDSVWSSRVNSRYRYMDDSWIKVWTPSQQQADPFFRASGGLFSTVSDYSRWLQTWISRVQHASGSNAGAGSAGYLDEGVLPLLSNEMARTALDPSEGPFHWRIMSTEPLVFGHHGIDGTVAMAIPSYGITIVYFSQSQGNDLRGQWMKAALEAVAPEEEFYRPVPSVPAEKTGLDVVELSPAQQKRYTGRYISGSTSIHIFLEAGRLQRKLPTPGSPRVTLVPLSKNHTFAMGRFVENQLTEILLPRQRLRFVVEEDRSTAVELIHDGKVRAVLSRTEKARQ